ncbi:CRISPR-associated protein Csm5 [Pilibacter termitis]|uniref:CRISPR system Cms protein Csm5 n=1 Tax=Pilibacter termitis TaxID=263852 RepID=A0A1T4NE18_9ENTE|nr:type III-A CRISPR-associated RAMP protein Csm5 [Pilibacter termitis]SJZ77018.1 CRISPR-associated protein Csm5 [Pilibacter termitis]
MTLKQYTFKLLTLAPVHVGSGENYSKKEVFFDGQKIYFPDLGEMYKVFCENGLEREFERFLQNGDTLSDFLLTKTTVKEKIKAISKISSSYPWALKKNKQGKLILPRMNVVAAQIKDPFGNPYIPGSSLKGALRNIILQYLIVEKRKENPEEIRKMMELSLKEKSDKEFTRQFLQTLILDGKNEPDAKYDIMKGVIVSDSKPLKKSSLIMVQKFDKLGKGTREGDNGHEISTFRQAIKPEVEVEFSITIDTSVYKDQEVALNLAEFFKKRNYRRCGEEETFESSRFELFVKSLNHQYTKEYLRKFELKNLDNIKKNTIYLGGGSGFLTKTIWMSLLDELDRFDKVERILDGQFSARRAKVYRDENRIVRKDLDGESVPQVIKIGKNKGKDNIAYVVEDRLHHGASPRNVKLVQYNGREYEMGKCCFIIKECEKR